MTDEHETTDGGEVLNLQQLVRTRMDERGWSYGDLERLSGYRLTKGRWQQIATGVRQTNFPVPANVQMIADVLEVDVTTVLLAAGRSLDLQVRPRGTTFGQLLPSGVDELSPRMRDGLLTIIRAAVAEHLASAGSEEELTDEEFSLRWSKSRPTQLRNSAAHTDESTA